VKRFSLVVSTHDPLPPAMAGRSPQEKHGPTVNMGLSLKTISTGEGESLSTDACYG